MNNQANFNPLYKISNISTDFNPLCKISNIHSYFNSHFVKFRIFTWILIHLVKFRIFTLISVSFINFRINTSISIHITRRLKIWHIRILWLLYIDKLDKFIFQKKGLKALYSVNHWATICWIRKNTASWLAEKILIIHFVGINKLNDFAGYLPTEN